ncbi:MAG: FmdB family transcriptional regulator [Candidatus Hydrogenedentes bacterium]|nr:FmdB family transcriptional regulator [Candidatus Hydrogenedentota bacterium]
MPVYTYQVIHDDGAEGETFEHVQGMSEAPLTEHPETGEKVVRVFQAPHVASRYNERVVKGQMDDKNLDRLGFTKYVRNGKGHYERTAGKAGPERLSTDD